MSDPPKTCPAQESLPPRTYCEAIDATKDLPDGNQTATLLLLSQMSVDFWGRKRKEQVLILLDDMKEMGVAQSDIATVMGVSNALVTKYKHQRQEHPDDLFRKPGRPSKIGKVFEKIVTFIESELDAHRSVTMGVLMEHLVDEVNVNVTRKRLLEFMKSHGFAYVSGIPTEEDRADVDKVKLRHFYTDTLPDAVEGVNPSLVFNMDEMGAERYADRKRINVFLPEDEAPEDGGVPVGVPRSMRRCTLVVCISLDGTRLTSAIITKTKTVNSLIFESGYDPEHLKLYTTKTSFITRDVFGEWLVDIFIPHVEATRERLRMLLGTFDERAVMLLDWCKSHDFQRHLALLRQKNVTVVFLVAHTSHLCQPLDLGVFGRLKNILPD